MHKFAFVIHPLDAHRDVARKYPVARVMPTRLIEWFLLRNDPIVAAKVTGILSLTGEKAEGWLIGCPLTPRMFMELPLETVYAKLEACGHVAEKLGAEIMGLGAFSSVVGDGGITLAKRLNIAVTTGNSYTVATAIKGACAAAELVGIELAHATVAIVGASGSIGTTCAELLVKNVGCLSLVGRDHDRLQLTVDGSPLLSAHKMRIRLSDDVRSGLSGADLVITVSSAAEAIIEPSFVKQGAVVCDVARPRDVSVRVARERNDVLIIEGGVVEVPGNMICTSPSGKPFSFGFPPGTAYACMSETMALALEGRCENFTLGKTVSIDQVTEITEICRRHGFHLGGWRSFEQPVTTEMIEDFRKRRATWYLKRAGH